MRVYTIFLEEEDYFIVSSTRRKWKFVCRCMDVKENSKANEKCFILIGKG
jgi:hypothetical protein